MERATDAALRDGMRATGLLLDVLHLLREIGREAAWMLGFPVRGRWRVHVWVHRFRMLRWVSRRRNARYGFDEGRLNR
jgi:hypothetical protein